jgi:hypothetical protein
MKSTRTPKTTRARRTSSRVTHQPPFALNAMIRTVAGDMNRGPMMRALAIADAFAARALRKADPEGFGGEDGWGGLVADLAPRYGSRQGLATVLTWAGQKDDDDLVLYNLLTPYVDAAFLLGLSLGYRMTVKLTGGGQ